MTNYIYIIETDKLPPCAPLRKNHSWKLFSEAWGPAKTSVATYSVATFEICALCGTRRTTVTDLEQKNKSVTYEPTTLTEQKK